VGDGRHGSSGHPQVRLFPIPWQQFGKSALWDVGDAAEHVGEPSQRIDVIELGRHDQRGHGGSPVGATFGAGEEPRFSAKCNLAVILPISGRMSSSTIAGIHCTGGACVAFRASGAHRANSCTWS
jgi:hypothetical protein